MREDLIKILANISEDYVGTIQKLVDYVTIEKSKSFEAGCKFMNPHNHNQVIKD